MELSNVKDYLLVTLPKLGYKLYDYKASTEGKRAILHITVDKVGYIDLNEISSLAETINNDLSNQINEDFLLDICSAGAEKQLAIEELSSYLNQYVYVSIHRAIDGLDHVEGNLKEVNDELIKVDVNFSGKTKNVDVNKTNIARIRLAIK